MLIYFARNGFLEFKEKIVGIAWTLFRQAILMFQSQHLHVK